MLADLGYEGAGCGVHVPVRKPAGGQELDVDTRTRNVLPAPPAAWASAALPS